MIGIQLATKQTIPRQKAYIFYHVIVGVQVQLGCCQMNGRMLQVSAEFGLDTLENLLDHMVSKLPLLVQVQVLLYCLLNGGVRP